MTTPNDGGPAFPCGPAGDMMTGEDGRTWHQFPPTCGMSLRAYFAGMAMASMAGNPDMLKAICERAKNAESDPGTITARMAVEYADALIAELERKG